MKKQKKQIDRHRQEKRDPSLKEVKIVDISYKKPEILKRFMSSRYKLLSSKRTGITAKIHRKLSVEIKKARILALLPFTDRHALG